MQYPLMSPPFEIIPFHEMNKEEAERHFNWYLSEVPKRMIILKEFYVRGSQSNGDELDYTAKSLIPLWRWYLKKVRVLRKTKAEYHEEIMQCPEYIRYCVSKKKVDLSWMEIAMDVGIYFSLCFLAYNEKFEWGYVTKPRNLDCVNRPVILGFDFKMKFSSMGIMATMIAKVVEGESKEADLAEIFDSWIETYLKSTTMI